MQVARDLQGPLQVINYQKVSFVNKVFEGKIYMTVFNMRGLFVYERPFKSGCLDLTDIKAKKLFARNLGIHF